MFRAVQDFVGREVAVKVENRTLDSERDQRRFLREARAAGRMSSHPYVVDLYDAGVTADQHPYLIMELCDGSYADRMKDAPLSPAEAREVGVKIADALADAHQLGVLHRDVKPANILFSRFGEPNLADFGLAILAETRDSSVTLEVLTPAYAPPEMFRHSAPSPAVDVYALCATLYAIMRGKPPRWRDDRSPSLITLMVLFAEPIPDLPGVPHALMEVLRAGMVNDPAARPSAEQLRDMLAAVPMGPPGPPGLTGPPGLSGLSGGAMSPAGPGAAGPVIGGLGAVVPGSPAPSPTPSSGGGYWPAPSSPMPGSPISGGGSVSGSASVSGGGPVSGGPTPGGSPVSGGPTPGGSGLYGRPVQPTPSGADSPGQVYPRQPHPGEPPFGVGDWAPGGFHGHDAASMAHTDRRRRRWGWLLGGLGAVVLLVAGGLGAWAIVDPNPNPSPTRGGTRSAAATPSRTPPLGGFALPGCLALLPERGRCPDGLECYDELSGSGDVPSADTVPCAGRHTWEVFALGDLPASADPADAESDAGVRALCNEGSFRVISLRLEQGWQFDVLPPSRKAFDSGDRTYRCLAGRGPDKLNGPTLIRQ